MEQLLFHYYLKFWLYFFSQPGIDMNSLPEISPMDHVFGGVEECEDDGGEEETMIDQSSFHYVASSNDIHQSSSIAYTTCLLALANMFRNVAHPGNVASRALGM